MKLSCICVMYLNQVYNEQIADLLNPAIEVEDFVILSPKERVKLEDKLKKLLKVSLAAATQWLFTLTASFVFDAI